MRILMLHNRYLIPGGEDESTQAETRLLRDNGCEVELIERHNSEVELIGRLRTAVRTLWARDSYHRIRSLLRERKFDVLHVQNFFPLWSPSIYYAANHERVPVVQSLRNYRLMCAASILYRDGHVCEDCVGAAVPLSALQHKCYRDNFAATSVVAAMQVAHRALGTWNDRVQRYIALTDFSKSRFVAAGIPSERISVKPNFVHPRPPVGGGGGGYAMFAARFTEEKGVRALLRAWSLYRGPLQLLIAGDGPLTAEVQSAAATDARIKYLGRKTPSELVPYMQGAEFIVFPSEWYEGMPRTVIESFAVGTPVLASDLGATATMILPGKNGWHFRPGDADDLSSSIEWCSSNLDKVRAVRKTTLADFEAKYTGAANVAQLLAIYRDAAETMSRSRVARA